MSEQDKTIQEELSRLSYEDAVKQLEQTVARLESGDITLDESMDLFRKGTILAQICAGKLDEIEKQITKLTVNQDGTAEETPFGED